LGIKTAIRLDEGEMNMPKQIGIMGGTFDPIHIGHLIAAESVRAQSKLDEVWFMPTHTPPHKEREPLATPEQRLAMVKLAVADNPYFRAKDIEIRKGGVSYTYVTMKLLQGKYPEYRFHYIIGADMIGFLPQWAHIDALVEIVSFIGLGRPGHAHDKDRLPPHIRKAVCLAEMPLIELSSTQIRQSCYEGKSIRYLVPEAVLSYMEVNRLYVNES
jgi:nicotinate-nucleotide adenylyltransferase